MRRWRAREILDDFRFWAGRTTRRLKGRWTALSERAGDRARVFLKDDWTNRGPRRTSLGSFLSGAITPRRMALAAGSNGLSAGVLVLYGVFVVFAPRLPSTIDLWDANRPPSLVILDRTGDELASRGADYGETVSIDELPPHLIDAVLATEDRRFYSHGGIDPRGLARAMVVNIRSGAIVQGGSTITQQLAKNAFLSSEKSATRKAKEAMLAIWIEGRYSKDEILSVYLNRIYLGAGAYGVDAAAHIYFGKSARELTLQEAAVIAALPKAPSTLAPTKNPEGAFRRAAEVIDNMVEDGRLDRATAEIAKAEPAVIVEDAEDAVYGYFLDYVIAKLDERAEIALSEDLIVRTTLDRRLQEAAEEAVRAVVEAEGEAGGFSQGALIACAGAGNPVIGDSQAVPGSDEPAGGTIREENLAVHIRQDDAKTGRVDGVRQRFRHQPSKGRINFTGREPCCILQHGRVGPSKLCPRPAPGGHKIYAEILVDRNANGFGPDQPTGKYGG